MNEYVYQRLLRVAQEEKIYIKPSKKSYTPRIDWKLMYPILKELKENKRFPIKKITAWLWRCGIEVSHATVDKNYKKFKEEEKEE